jgi:hypothetical protein
MSDNNESSLATYWYLCDSFEVGKGLYRYKFSTKQFNSVVIEAECKATAIKKLLVNLPEDAKFSSV